jgi:hypothetical protein
LWEMTNKPKMSCNSFKNKEQNDKMLKIKFSTKNFLFEMKRLHKF